jgi:hypothetical protein
MEKNKSIRVTEKTAKLRNDQTDWNKLYSQSEDETEEKAKSDLEAPELKSKFYTKPGNTNDR